MKQRVRNIIGIIVVTGVLYSPLAAVWKDHAVRQINGWDKPITLAGQLQIVTESWNRAVAVPYIIYMPEKDQLLMLVSCDYPHHAMVLTSDDHGASWSRPRDVHTDGQGKPDTGMGTGLTYLGGGNVILLDNDRHWFSGDYGQTWESLPSPPAANGLTWNEWDPPLVDRDSQGRVTRLMSFSGDNRPKGEEHWLAFLRFSDDGGRTWYGERKAPELCASSEVGFCRAANGDIVAACRTDAPDRFKDKIDHYEGLGVSVSKDNGQTWSAMNRLYEWGRHHPCLVLTPNGDLVMTYVVRKGYVNTPDDFPQFGIEAVVSKDNGQTWDLDHRYVLHTWASNRKAFPDEKQPVPQGWWASSQATSSLLLPDGSILTAFGTGYRVQPGLTEVNKPSPRDVGLVLWRLGNQPLNDDHTLRNAPWDSEQRNLCDPDTARPIGLARAAMPCGRKLGTIFNSDNSNILVPAGRSPDPVGTYRSLLERLMAMKPHVLAQSVGLPDAVIYRTKVATTFDKHLVEVSRMNWPDYPKDVCEGRAQALQDMFKSGTDPLQLTIEACRRHDVIVVASYRMNGEDWYQNTWLLSDFDRSHPDYRIPAQKDTPSWGRPLTGCLDPAIREVYEYRMKIFREVVDNYDIDGLEFDYRRWYHMISDPQKNHGILTQMVRDARKMLDEAARRKGRSKLLLGVRVAPSLDRPANVFLHPGAWHAEDLEHSCTYYGLDVQTWVKEGLVDYICPSEFLGQLPGVPFTREFADLTKGTDIGVYPTLWPLSGWMHEIIGVERAVSLEEKDQPALSLYRYDLCSAALRMYDDGADGISAYNWVPYLDDPYGGPGPAAVARYFFPFADDRAAIRNYLDQPWAIPPR
jgi:hypothetical protein